MGGTFCAVIIGMEPGENKNKKQKTRGTPKKSILYKVMDDIYFHASSSSFVYTNHVVRLHAEFIYTISIAYITMFDGL